MPDRRSGSVIGLVMNALLVLVAIAIGAHVIYDMLAPLLPFLLGLTVGATLLWFALRRS